MADSSERTAQVIPLHHSPISVPNPKVLPFAGWDDGHPVVVGALGTPVRARVLASVRLPPDPGEGAEVLVVFDDGQPERPVIVGLLAPSEPVADPMEVQVDGRRVVLTGEDEIELRCGKASIVLRRNGRVVLRGAYVETHSEGVNRIKGGTVSIN